MRDWQKLKEWAESYRNCPADFQMGAEVVRPVMEDLLALIAENDELRKVAKDFRDCARIEATFGGEARAEIRKLREIVSEAANEIEEWGAYASDYFAEKHDLAGCVKRYRDIGNGDADV